MLRKSENVRPSLARVQVALRTVPESARAPSPHIDAIGRVAAEQAAEEAAHEAKILEVAERKRQRQCDASEALKNLALITDELFGRILNSAPNAKHEKGVVRIGKGSLFLQVESNAVPEGRFARSGWNVIAAASIAVMVNPPTGYKWSASLWYGNNILKDVAENRWYECAYMSTPSTKSRLGDDGPFDLLADPGAADVAAAPGIRPIQFGQTPNVIPIDHEDAEKFIDRWLAQFAQACQGALRRPQLLPVHIP
jgi:hypothetical protein